MRMLSLLALLLAAMPASANEQKIIRLEQDMRNLERRVQDQAREIEQLRRQLGTPSTPRAAQAAAPAPSPDAAWLKAANWERVRPGLEEFAVIDALGPPTSVRGGAEQGTKILFYAMEIGTAAFLSGSVQLQDGKVAAVERPALR